jgi:hypothetical protein
MTSIYNHRASSYDERNEGRGYRVLPETPIEKLQDPGYTPLPFYWVSTYELEKRLSAQNWPAKWLLGYSEVASATNRRTFVSTIIPRVAVGHKTHLIFPDFPRLSGNLVGALVGNLSSIVFDYLARQKVGGISLSLFIVRQLPALSPKFYGPSDLEFIGERILELTYTSHDLKPWAEDLGYNGPPFRFDPERRALLRAELDAFYAHLYGLNRDELRYILDPADVMGPDYPSETFRVLKTNEIRQFGEYRTQRLVLEAWDRLFGGD